MTAYDIEPKELIEKTSEELKNLIKAPDWTQFVKTGSGKERPPVENDWYYTRAASILRIIYIKGPVGVQKLRMKYGNKKNRGNKPNMFYKASGKIIRVILQELEKVGLIQYKKEGPNKGRIITGKGKSLLDKLARK